MGSNDRRINEEGIGKVMEGSGHVLISGRMTKFEWGTMENHE
jgi:hypothetical protein